MAVECELSPVEVLLRAIEAEVVNYIKLYGKAPRLLVLNRRYGVDAKRLSGRPLKVLLESDERFTVNSDAELRSYVSATAAFE